MKLEQAARQSLKAMEDASPYGLTFKEAITALREALGEQAEQEPVAWGYFDADGSFMDALDRQHGAYQTPLYAVPVRTKNLTDDEILKALGAKSYDECSERELADAILDARAVIAADREKNK